MEHQKHPTRATKTTASADKQNAGSAVWLGHDAGDSNGSNGAKAATLLSKTGRQLFIQVLSRLRERLQASGLLEPLVFEGDLPNGCEQTK